MGEVSRADVINELSSARDALHDAGVLIEGDGSSAGIYNRLYYATFHAAQAALYARDINPSSHGDVRRQFGQHVVLDGAASREQGRLLGVLYDYRQAADYRASQPTADVDELQAAVGAFVSHIESIVEAPGEES